MKNLILIYDGEYYQFDTLEELKKFFIPNFKSLSDSNIEKILYEKIFGFSIMNNLKILNSKKGVYEGNYGISKQKVKDYDKVIIIDNLDTYILSLCKHNVITILEEINNRVYTKKIKYNLKDDNYINVNAYASEILIDLVGDTK